MSCLSRYLAQFAGICALLIGGCDSSSPQRSSNESPPADRQASERTSLRSSPEADSSLLTDVTEQLGFSSSRPSRGPTART